LNCSLPCYYEPSKEEFLKRTQPKGKNNGKKLNGSKTREPNIEIKENKTKQMKSNGRKLNSGRIMAGN
jgi:hypothetical protein